MKEISHGAHHGEWPPNAQQFRHTALLFNFEENEAVFKAQGSRLKDQDWSTLAFRVPKNRAPSSAHTMQSYLTQNLQQLPKLVHEQPLQAHSAARVGFRVPFDESNVKAPSEIGGSVAKSRPQDNLCACEPHSASSSPNLKCEWTLSLFQLGEILSRWRANWTANKTFLARHISCAQHSHGYRHLLAWFRSCYLLSVRKVPASHNAVVLAAHLQRRPQWAVHREHLWVAAPLRTPRYQRDGLAGWQIHFHLQVMSLTCSSVTSSRLRAVMWDDHHPARYLSQHAQRVNAWRQQLPQAKESWDKWRMSDPTFCFTGNPLHGSHKRQTSEARVSSKERKLFWELRRVNRHKSQDAQRQQNFLRRKAQEAKLAEEISMEDDVYFKRLRAFEFAMSEALDAQRRGILQEAAQDLNKDDYNAFNCAETREISKQNYDYELCPPRCWNQRSGSKTSRNSRINKKSVEKKPDHEAESLLIKIRSRHIREQNYVRKLV